MAATISVVWGLVGELEENVPVSGLASLNPDTGDANPDTGTSSSDANPDTGTSSSDAIPETGISSLFQDEELSLKFKSHLWCHRFSEEMRDGPKSSKPKPLILDPKETLPARSSLVKTHM